jgi:hypothetical protein
MRQVFPTPVNADRADVRERITGALLMVVGKDPTLEVQTRQRNRSSVREAEGVTLQFYSFSQLGFHPGPISASLF